MAAPTMPAGKEEDDGEAVYLSLVLEATAFFSARVSRIRMFAAKSLKLRPGRGKGSGDAEADFMIGARSRSPLLPTGDDLD